MVKPVLPLIACFALVSPMLAAAGENRGEMTEAGDAERGALIYDSRCIGCHSLAANRIGPRHDDVFGREIGALDDFDYSEALRTAVGTWDRVSLDRWLADPEAYLPGQRMNVMVAQPQDRADLIAFLRREAER